jgi:hypothetical protein
MSRGAARDRRPVQLLGASLVAVLPLALLLANVEVQIEGSAGWAANLPTWRIEDGWLLDLFWGGRPMTGYHVYIFSWTERLRRVKRVGRVAWGRQEYPFRADEHDAAVRSSTKGNHHVATTHADDR